MTKEQREEIVKTLLESKHSGFTKGDEKLLEAASDERLEAFVVASEARAKADADLKAAATRELTEEEWLKGAAQHPGSWWSDWLEWLKIHGEDTKVPARQPGDGGLKPIEDAPGRYVKVRD